MLIYSCYTADEVERSTNESVNSSSSRDNLVTESSALTNYSHGSSIADSLHDQLPPLTDRINTTTNETATTHTQDISNLVSQGQAYRMTINMAYGSLPSCNNTE